MPRIEKRDCKTILRTTTKTRWPEKRLLDGIYGINKIVQNEFREFQKFR